MAAFNQIGIGVYSGSITVKTREGGKTFASHFLLVLAIIHDLQYLQKKETKKKEKIESLQQVKSNNDN